MSIMSLPLTIKALWQRIANTSTAIKAIAKISNKNSVEAKKMIETPPAVIFSGKAVQVKAVLALLDSLLIAYTVTPEFPYSLTQES